MPYRVRFVVGGAARESGTMTRSTAEAFARHVSRATIVEVEGPEVPEPRFTRVEGEGERRKIPSRSLPWGELASSFRLERELWAALYNGHAVPNYRRKKRVTRAAVTDGWND